MTHASSKRPELRTVGWWELRPIIEAGAPSTGVLYLYVVARAPPRVVMIATDDRATPRGRKAKGRTRYEGDPARPRTV